eukprot:scaffold4102_cov168-Amphora_coffeaeformis.AAC.4
MALPLNHNRAWVTETRTPESTLYLADDMNTFGAMRDSDNAMDLFGAADWLLNVQQLSLPAFGWLSNVGICARWL